MPCSLPFIAPSRSVYAGNVDLPTPADIVDICQINGGLLGSIRNNSTRRRSRLDAPHAQYVQSQREVEPQVSILGERPEEPFQLADAVAQRVVVKVQAAGRLGDVEVGLQQHLQRPAQVDRLR